MLTDVELLSQYAREGSEAAFGDLVGRHVDLVYTTALRALNGDEHLARDVAQSIFTDLARKADKLCHRLYPRGGQAPGNPSLAGWLFTSTRFAACKAVRAEQTRRKYEQEAQIMADVFHKDCDERDWAELRPELEEVMGKIAESDRDAVLLRFFEGEEFAAVGARLGISEEAARKRVTRALDKLRDLLIARGIKTTAAALSVTLTAHAAGLAPAGLAAALTTGALAAAAATASGSTTILSLLKAMASMKLKLGIATVLVTAVGTPLYLQRQANRQLQATTGQLQQTNGQLQDEVERLRTQLSNRPMAVGPPANSAPELEVLRLRGQIGRLRLELAEKEARANPDEARQGLSEKQLANLAEPGGWRDGKFLPKEKISNLGLSTPEAAVQTYLWSLLQEDPAAAEGVLGQNPNVNLKVMREEFADRLGSAAGVHFDGYSSNAQSFTALFSVQDTNNAEMSRRVTLRFQEGNWRVVDDQWTPGKVLYGPDTTKQGPSSR